MSDNTLDRWVAALSAELSVELEDLDVQALLDVARDAAHSVVRPAAPLSTFLVGYAAGKRAAAGNDIADECAKASGLANAWPAP